MAMRRVGVMRIKISPNQIFPYQIKVIIKFIILIITINVYKWVTMNAQ